MYIFFISFLLNHGSHYSPETNIEEKIVETKANLEAKWCREKEQCISLEVADTAYKREIGLMYRKYLPKGVGMLFLFSPPELVRLWMRDTLIPLDMIFYSNNLVVHLEKNIPPCKALICKSYGPNQKIDGVIEIAAGEVDKMNLKLGDYIDIDY